MTIKTIKAWNSNEARVQAIRKYPNQVVVGVTVIPTLKKFRVILKPRKRKK